MSEKSTQNDKSLARLLAVQALFEVEATRRHYQEVTLEILSENPGHFLGIEGENDLKVNKKLTQEIVSDAVYHQVKIDQTVNGILKEGWPLKSVDPTLRAIFRAAGAEFIRGRAPYKVVINEYLNITRAFDDQKETVAFVNAVLDSTRKAWDLG